MLEFDPAGNWCGTGADRAQGYDWPESNHGIPVDHKDNVWIGGNGAEGRAHPEVHQGRQVPACSSASPGKNARAATTPRTSAASPKIFVDPKANEAYIADGYGNKRVAVLDADTGKCKRYWGAYGNKPDDTDLGRYDPDAPPAQQFRNPVHCAELSNDGLVYVCDRANDRIQVFTPDGTFVKEAFVAKDTLGDGSVWDIAFSKDPQQTYIYPRRRQERAGLHHRCARRCEILTSFGDGGRQPGQFFGVHSIATDSKGNIYTTETYEGKRAAEVRLQGHRHGRGREAGCAVAEISPKHVGFHDSCSR